jgi:Transposase and inactivated derivatives, IS30 family
MPEGYLHLTCEQRCQIYALLQSGHSQAHIARKIGVDPSTISRELVRNTGARLSLQASAREGLAETQGGLGQAAQNDAGPGGADRGETDARAVESRSDQRPSGEGWRRLYQSRAHLSACLERQERRGALHLHLRHSGKKYNKRKGKNSGRGLIPNRVDIDQRPSVVAAKSRIGDWEADTIIGAKHRGAVMSHVERKSKYTKLAKLRDKTADSVVRACARVLLPLADRIKTITYDNGKEFASHVEIATSLGSLSYFAKPYHSWERGLNEHTNGLFRQYFPKGSDLSIVSDTDVQRSRINSTLAPERYSATELLVRFSSTPTISPLHFAVEWAF